MTILQPVLQPVLRPLLADPLAPGFGDSLTAAVKALFASGEKGVMFDLTRSANLYTDSARTTLVTASGEGVGSCTDLSPNAKHASSIGSARPTWNSAGYATFDAFDDYLQTAAIDLTGTDAVTVVAAVRKLSDVSIGMPFELGPNTATNPGSLRIQAPGTAGGANIGLVGGGTAQVNVSTTGLESPITLVATAEQDISAPLMSLRINGGAANTTASTQGTGNLGNYAINIGARATSSLFFNGRIYRLLVIGRALTTTERNLAERWAAQPVGITIP